MCRETGHEKETTSNEKENLSDIKALVLRYIYLIKMKLISNK